MASTPRSCASLRMLSASSPPSSAMLIAARSTRSLLKGTRGSALRSTRDAISVLLAFDPRRSEWVRGLDNLTAYGSVLRCTNKRGGNMFANVYADEAAPPTTMKAIVRERYGSPDVLELKNIDRPAIDDDSMLVRVRAASINAYDWHMLRGSPSLVRLMAGLRKPKSSAMGVDVAGQ